VICDLSKGDTDTAESTGKSFRKGFSLVKFTQMFPDDATAEKWFVEQPWPEGVTCPCCQSKSV